MESNEHNSGTDRTRYPDGVSSSDRVYGDSRSAHIASRTDVVRYHFSHSPLASSSSHADVSSYPPSSLPAPTEAPFPVATFSHRLPPGFEASPASYPYDSTTTHPPAQTSRPSQAPSSFYFVPEVSPATYAESSVQPYYNKAFMEYEYPALEGIDFDKLIELKIAYKSLANDNKADKATDQQRSAAVYFERLCRHKEKVESGQTVTVISKEPDYVQLEPYHEQSIMEQEYSDLKGMNIKQVSELRQKYWILIKENRKRDTTDEQRQANAYLAMLSKIKYGKTAKIKSRRKGYSHLKEYHNQESMESDYPDLKGKTLDQVYELKKTYNRLRKAKKYEDLNKDLNTYKSADAYFQALDRRAQKPSPPSMNPPGEV